MKRITKIEAIEKTQNKLRVAAYARVSTDKLDQLISLESQKNYYETYIKSSPNWEYAGLYYDEGLSGTKMVKRNGLLRMLSDCEKGQIDFIIIKSISRFARNTTECLEVVRKLIKLKIFIYFEEENINTGKMDSELLLTIFSSLAESESISISENTSWAVQKRFQSGTFKISYPPYGFKNVKGEMVIDNDEAEIVRYIFNECLSGKGCYTIAKLLREKNIPSKRGCSWSPTAVKKVLKNEKYMGDALFQKTFTDSRFERHPNRGERPQYYASDHHEAIVGKTDFEAAQKIIAQRAREKNIAPEDEKYLNRYPFSGKIICAECGNTWRRRTHTDRKVKYYAYACNTHLEDKTKCGQLFLREDALKVAFVNMINKLIFSQKAVLQPLLNSLKNIDRADVISRINALEDAIDQNFDRRQTLVSLLSKQYIEPALYAKESSELLSEAMTLRSEKESLCRNTNGDLENVEAVKSLLNFINSAGSYSEFDSAAFSDHVDHIIVYSREEIGFALKCGLNLKERL